MYHRALLTFVSDEDERYRLGLFDSSHRVDMFRDLAQRFFVIKGIDEYKVLGLRIAL